MKSDPQCLRLPGLPLFEDLSGKAGKTQAANENGKENVEKKEVEDNNVCKIVFVISTIHLQSETIVNRWLNLNGIFKIFEQCSLLAAKLQLKQRCILALRETHSEPKSNWWLNFHYILNRRPFSLDGTLKAFCLDYAYKSNKGFLRVADHSPYFGLNVCIHYLNEWIKCKYNKNLPFSSVLFSQRYEGLGCCLDRMIFSSNYCFIFYLQYKYKYFHLLSLSVY